jgi:hypothetical protein
LAQFFIGIWRALTATGRLLFLGATEAWGFWLTTIPLLLVILFAATICNGIAWRLIEGRLHPKMRDKETEARLREEIRELKVKLYDSQEEQERLELQNADQERVIEVERNFNRNWNAAAGKATAQQRAT